MMGHVYGLLGQLAPVSITDAIEDVLQPFYTEYPTYLGAAAVFTVLVTVVTLLFRMVRGVKGARK